METKDLLSNVIKSNLLPFLLQNSPLEAQSGEESGAVRGSQVVAERGWMLGSSGGEVGPAGP